MEDVLLQEHEEFEALLSLMRQDDGSRNEQDPTPFDFGSDDDSMFLNAVAEVETKSNGPQDASKAITEYAPDSSMDTSMG